MTTETMTLTDFLLARIAEVEMFAEGIEDVTYRPRWTTAPNGDVLLATLGLDPRALLLAECEAKRRIVELCRSGDWEGPHFSSGLADATDDLAMDVLTALALPYADHEDYDEAWRP